MSRRSQKAAQRRIAAARARKERRKKVIAFGGLGVLAVLVFIQGPRMLDVFGGAGDASPTALPALRPQAAPPGGEPKIPRLRTSGLDPFAARVIADAEPQAGIVSPPPGAQDPFAPVTSAAPAPTEPAAPQPPVSQPTQPLPKTIVVGTPKTPSAVGRRGWIVVLASIPVASGRSSADRFAARVRRNGLTGIGVLESSRRRPLRAGYFVVYNGPYSSLRAVQRAADHVHAFGYRTAYVREIIRY